MPAADAPAVRLSPEELRGLREALTEQFGATSGAQAWLFGSRADLAARGGDIDLYLELPRPVNDALALVRRLQLALERKLGERKIDIVIKAPNLADSVLHRIAKQRGVLIWRKT